MKIFVFEENLMWSARLVKTLRAHGHEPVLCTVAPSQAEGATVAIVNLGQTKPDPKELVRDLHGLGLFVIAHAGHKEKELHALGKEAGADRLATNSELTFKLPQMLEALG